jgi:2'-5' RNA ligase
MRLFFCVELDEQAKNGLSRLMDRLKARCPTGKWVAPENLHLTVRFLGEVGEGRLGELENLAQTVAGEFLPFTLELGKLSAFPSPKRARVLWVGPVKGEDRFVELMRAVEEGVRRLGFRPETKTPTAHVTVARFKTPRDLSGLLAEVEFEDVLPVEVREITLMRSTLRPEGPIYTPVFRVPLGGS